MYFGSKPYDLEGYLEHQGDGNMYRGEYFGQPRTLMPGDVLINGLEIAERWYEAGNGGVGLTFTDGTTREVAARIPLLLKGGTYGELPEDLNPGDILETGCVVLDEPREIEESDPRFESGRHEIGLTIAGGFSGHSIEVPKDLVIALHSESYPPNPDTKFGAYIIERTLEMGARARRNLPDYGRLDHEPETDRIKRVFVEIEALREQAQAERAKYHETLVSIREKCSELCGVELLITGQLEARGHWKRAIDSPESRVNSELIEVSSVSVNTYESYGMGQHIPYLEVSGYTVDSHEQMSGRLNVGKLSLTAEIFDGRPAQA